MQKNNTDGLILRFLNSWFGRYWRIIATGIAFTTFGLVGLIGGLGVLPLVVVFSFFAKKEGAKKYSHLISQRFISWWFRRFYGLMRNLGLLSYELHDIELLQKPGQLIIANHPTLIDTVFLIGLTKNPCVLIGSNYRHNFFLSAAVTAAGYVCNDEPQGLLENCAEALQSNKSLIIFPEGTRTKPGKPTKVQRGAANIAIYAKQDFRPIFVTCNPVTLIKNEPWWRSPNKRPHWSFKVMPPIVIQPFIEQSPSSSIAARHLSRYLEHYYNTLIAADKAGHTLDSSVIPSTEEFLHAMQPSD